MGISYTPCVLKFVIGLNDDCEPVRLHCRAYELCEDAEQDHIQLKNHEGWKLRSDAEYESADGRDSVFGSEFIHDDDHVIVFWECTVTASGPIAAANTREELERFMSEFKVESEIFEDWQVVQIN